LDNASLLFLLAGLECFRDFLIIEPAAFIPLDIIILKNLGNGFGAGVENDQKVR